MHSLFLRREKCCNFFGGTPCATLAIHWWFSDNYHYSITGSSGGSKPLFPLPLPFRGTSLVTCLSLLVESWCGSTCVCVFACLPALIRLPSGGFWSLQYIISVSWQRRGRFAQCFYARTALPFSKQPTLVSLATLLFRRVSEGLQCGGKLGMSGVSCLSNGAVVLK